ncbi:MAG: alpha/beta fold hydrolase [Roseitalea sp.]|nr:alpha/beta fold hydrolase [Roseitalea sp.]MBO6721287.1 alpha/beta fold hydrolase [Roseitalea sp.]MBO6742228.1 alpha/beta fold hydrolase [Roseitalea sp.]
MSRKIIMVVIALAVAGCATGPTSFAPVQTLPEGAVVEPMLVATTRAPSTEGAFGYATSRSAALSFADVRVSIPPDRETGQLPYPGRTVDPRREFVAAGLETGLDRQAFAARLNDRLSGRPDDERGVFIFVHGYNTDFAEGVFLQAQIAHDFDVPGTSVNFSWASAGLPPAYLYDRESAQIARDDLVETLRIVARSAATEIALMGHSMGGVLVMEALRQLSLTGDTETLRRIGVVVLASPDIDVDLFKRQYHAIAPRPPAWLIFVSRRDPALRASSRLRGGAPRVGSGSDVDALNGLGIAVVDLTTVGGRDLRGEHRRFASSPLVISMIRDAERVRTSLGQSDARALEAVANDWNTLGSSVANVLRLPQVPAGP